MRPKKSTLVVKQDNFMGKLPGRTDGFQKAAQLNKKLNQRDYKYARVREMVDDIIVSEND